MLPADLRRHDCELAGKFCPARKKLRATYSISKILQSELHRAVRLVLDTGMHALGWSREKAIDYSIAIEGVHIDEATSEVERYVVWPGQALGYKMGELKILELRQRAKKQLAEKFDIGLFHDKILENGALPLNLMDEKIVNNYVHFFV